MRRLPFVLLAVLLVNACVTITPLGQRDPPSQSSQPTPSAGPSVPVVAVGPTEPQASPGPTRTHKPKPTRTPNSDATDPPTSAPAETATPEPSDALDPDDPACSDDAYDLVGFAWDKPYRWMYNAATTPAAFDPADVVAVIKRGFENVTSERNDCGRPDRVSAVAEYIGDADAKACDDVSDDVNVVAWGSMPGDLGPDTIAYTCTRSGGATGDVARGADIVISDKLDWALKRKSCTYEELLEPTITHEAGHVFGLGHVSERKHPWLTMSTGSNGPCDDDESTLGLGDMLGLEQLYP